MVARASRNDPRRAMIGERRFRARDDLLSFVCEENDQIVPFVLLCRSIEAAQRMKVVGQFEDRVDVKPFRWNFCGMEMQTIFPLSI